MMALLEDIAQYLIDNSLATSLGSDIFIDSRPDGPDNIIVLTEYAGPPTKHAISAVQRRIQIVVRDKSIPSARNRIWDVFNVLDQTESVLEIPNRRLVTQALQTPFRLDIDDKNRSIYAFNLGITTTRD